MGDITAYLISLAATAGLLWLARTNRKNGWRRERRGEWLKVEELRQSGPAIGNASRQAVAAGPLRAQTLRGPQDQYVEGLVRLQAALALHGEKPVSRKEKVVHPV